MEVIPARTLNGLNIILDICFLVILLCVLLYTKRYQAVLAGLAGSLIYMLVDYGIFYQLLGTRQVTGADPFWFLLWLSTSYGFTNFAWIWLWLDNDGHKLEWSTLIISGWFATALMGRSFGDSFATISIMRGTGSYHGVMALLLFAGYAILCVYNLRCKAGEPNAPLLQILSIGILVQGAWEFVLLVTGIRPMGLAPLIVNALLETNMGLPYLYLIHRGLNKRRGEDLRPTSLRGSGPIPQPEV